MHYSTKIIELGSCAFRQPKATSHCRFIHGYRLTAKFWFAANELDENNWVVDFGSLKELKKLLQQQFDHTTCIARTDPKLDEFKRLDQAGVCDLRIMDDGVGIEKFAEWCHAAADNFAGVLTKMRCRCIRVEVFEHENNSAIYEEYPAFFRRSTKTVDETDSSEDEHNEPTVKEIENEKSSTIEGMIRQSTDNPLKKDFAGNDLPSEPKDESDTSVNKRTGQVKTKGSWVDPKYKGKTKNTWMF